MKADVILLVTTLGGGGTEKYVTDLAIGLHKNGLSCLVVADSEPLTRKKDLEDEDVPVQVLGVDSSWSKQRYITELKDTLKRTSAQVINVQVWERFEWQVEAAESLNIPVVKTHHGFTKLKLRDWLGINKKPFWLHRARHFMRRHKVPIICVARNAVDSIKNVYGKDIPVGVVHAAIDIPKCSEEGLNKADNIPTIIWIGQMIERKRPFDALKVFIEVRKVVPDVRLLMLGDGPMYAEVSQRAAALSPYIEMIGYTKDIWKYIWKSHVSLMTSSSECLPLVLLESMAAGVPVVSTNIGEVEEIVIGGCTGYLAKVGDTRSLASKCIAILSNPEMQIDMGAQARSMIRKQFTSKALVEDTVAFYRTHCGFEGHIPEREG